MSKLQFFILFILLLIFGFGGFALADSTSTLLISDFEPNEGIWYGFNTVSSHKTEGFIFSSDYVKSGTTSGKLANTITNNRLMAKKIPHDWSSYSYLSMWIYSEKATKAGITLACYSDPPTSQTNNKSDNYYSRTIFINWTGWKLVEIPLTEFKQTKNPVGWNKIDSIKIATSGWGGTPSKDTVVYFDRMELSVDSVLNELPNRNASDSIANKSVIETGNGAMTANQTSAKNSTENNQFLMMDTAGVYQLKQQYQNGDPKVVAAVNGLTEAADTWLKKGLFSVMDKKTVAPSGDKHDYVSIGIYWWPDPKETDGKPYIRRDGLVNPEVHSNNYDEAAMGNMILAVRVLSRAYFYTGNKVYAQHAAELLRTWFLDPDTKMNPNLNYGQMIPGVEGGGRPEGIIETSGFTDLIDSAQILYASTDLSQAELRGLKQWLADYLKWLLQNDLGRKEDKYSNNHSVWYDTQVVAFALFIGQKELATKVIQNVQKHVATHIELDGSMPNEELMRTRSLHYLIYNLKGFMSLAMLGDQVGVDLWHFQTIDGRGIQKTLDYVTPFLSGAKTWQGPQIIKEDESAFASYLRLAAVKYNNQQYLTAADKLLEGKLQIRPESFLFYPEPQLGK